MHHVGPELVHHAADLTERSRVPRRDQRAPHCTENTLAPDVVTPAHIDTHLVTMTFEQRLLELEDLVLARRGGRPVVVVSEKDPAHRDDQVKLFLLAPEI